MARGELLDRDEPRGLLDARLELVAVLQPGSLRRDEPEDDALSRGQEPQRLEAAGAGVVVLQEEPVDVEAAEEGLGDEVVAALGAQDERKLPRHRCVVTVMPAGRPAAPR